MIGPGFGRWVFVDGGGGEAASYLLVVWPDTHEVSEKPITGWRCLDSPAVNSQRPTERPTERPHSSPPARSLLLAVYSYTSVPRYGWRSVAVWLVIHLRPVTGLQWETRSWNELCSGGKEQAVAGEAARQPARRWVRLGDASIAEFVELVGGMQAAVGLLLVGPSLRIAGVFLRVSVGAAGRWALHAGAPKLPIQH